MGAAGEGEACRCEEVAAGEEPLHGRGLLLEGLEVFAGFEADGAAGGDVDFCAGAGIAADARFAGFYGEDAEAAEFDAVALGEGGLHGAEDGVDRGFGLGAGQAGALDDALDEVLLDQAGTPFGWGVKRADRQRSPTSPMVGRGAGNVNGDGVR